MTLFLPALKNLACMTGLVAVLSFTGNIPTFAAEMPSVLTGLVGSWRGNGTARAQSGGTNENVSCKARYTDMEADESLRVEVTCAGLNAKGTLVGFIEYGAGTSDFVGNWYQNWSTSEGEENGSLTGTISSNKIRMNVSAAGTVRARLDIQLTNANQHSVNMIGIVDGVEEQGMNITFSR